MKTRLAMLSVMYLINLLTAYGQNQTRLGIIGGLNASQMKSSTNLSDLLWRYHVGVAFEKQFSRDFAFATDLLYSRQGGSVIVNTGSSDKNITTFDYLTLPVLVRFRPRRERGFVEAGGQAGYLLKNEAYNTSDRSRTSESFNHTRKLDAGITGGIGYRIGKHLIIDARYYYGMRPIRKNHMAPAPITGIPTFYHVDRWYNRVWSLNLAYYF